MSIHDTFLALISFQPAGVYWLKQMPEDQTCSAWPLNIGRIYQTMQCLERAGCVTSHREADASQSSEVFRTTDTDRAILDEWWPAPVTREQSERGGLVMKPAAAAIGPSVDVTSSIQMQRHTIRVVLHEATRMNESTDDGEPAQEFILESHIFGPEAESKWLNHIETGAISQASRQAGFTASKRRPRRDTA